LSRRRNSGRDIVFLRDGEIQLAANPEPPADLVKQDVAAARAAGDRDGDRPRRLRANGIFDCAPGFLFHRRGKARSRPIRGVDHVAREEENALHGRWRSVGSEAPVFRADRVEDGFGGLSKHARSRYIAG
jgi:hypothetical protein